MTIFSKLNIKAVGIGFLVDILVTTSVSFIIVILWTVFDMDWSALVEGDEAIVEDYFDSLAGVTLYMAISLFFGLFCTSLGGFVAASISKVNEVYNAVSVGAVGLLLYFLLMPFLNMPLWYDAVSIVLILPAAYMGGVVVLKNKKSRGGSD